MRFICTLLFVLSLLTCASADAVKDYSVQLPADVNAWHNLVYSNVNGNTPLLLDLYVPKRSQPVPLIIYIHGGGWARGTKDQVLMQYRQFFEKGYAIASVQYRLTDRAIFPAQIRDCKAAVRFLRANAAKYNIDADRFGAWGASAGGHLVALMGTTGDSKVFDCNEGEYQNVSSAVQAVCDWCGPTDLTLFAPDPNNPDAQRAYDVVTKLIGGPVAKRLDAAKFASPVTYVSSSCPPFLILHGTDDKVVPSVQSQLLYNALKKAGIYTELKLIPKFHHGVASMSDPNVAAAEVKFFDKYLKSR